MNSRVGSITISAGAFVLNEPNQTEKDFQVFSQWNDDAIESGLKRTLSALVDKLVNAIYGNKNSISEAVV